MMASTHGLTGDFGHDPTDRRIAYALLRLTLGINICMHGVSRLLAGHAFTATITAQFAHSPLPYWSLVAFAGFLPWAEGILGFLILLGLWTRLALMGGALLIVLLTFGISLVQQWEIAGLQLIYAIVYAALLFLLSYNSYSLDAALRKTL